MRAAATATPLRTRLSEYTPGDLKLSVCINLTIISIFSIPPTKHTHHTSPPLFTTPSVQHQQFLSPTYQLMTAAAVVKVRGSLLGWERFLWLLLPPLLSALLLLRAAAPLLT
jgi:hypothetical protein